MNEGRQKFYNTLYKNAQQDVFGGGKPINIVQKISTLISKGEALDFGCGMGRHSIYLAQQGFRVTAIDFSEEGIAKLQAKAVRENLPILAYVADIETWIPAQDFDVVLVSHVLHQITEKSVKKILKNLQDHTKSGGIHAIATFTKEGAFFDENPNTDTWYADSGELKSLYDGWEIVSYEESEGNSYKADPNGKPYVKTTAFLLAQKK